LPEYKSKDDAKSKLKTARMAYKKAHDAWREAIKKKKSDEEIEALKKISDNKLRDCVAIQNVLDSWY
jgi:hypothetical protein